MVGPSSEKSGCSRTTAAVPRAPSLPFVRARAAVPLLPPRVTPPHRIWIPWSVRGGGGVEHGDTIENSRRWRWGGPASDGALRRRRRRSRAGRERWRWGGEQGERAGRTTGEGVSLPYAPAPAGCRSSASAAWSGSYVVAAQAREALVREEGER
jgi:hypothetical protein